MNNNTSTSVPANTPIAETNERLAEDMKIVAEHAEALMLSGDIAGARELWERICKTKFQPSALAALILCELVESTFLHKPGRGYARELATSREFIAWYKKLIAAKAQPAIERVNERTEKLSRALPSAAGVLEKAMFEAEHRGLAEAVS
jgi:hypothetical protein